RRRVKPQDHPHGGGLARAVGAQESGHHTGPDGERQPVDGELVAVPLRQSPCLDHYVPPLGSSASGSKLPAHDGAVTGARSGTGLGFSPPSGAGPPGGSRAPRVPSVIP